MSIMSEKDQCDVELDELRREILFMEGQYLIFQSMHRPTDPSDEHFTRANDMSFQLEVMIDRLNDILAFDCKPGSSSQFEEVLRPMQRIVNNRDDIYDDPIGSIDSMIKIKDLIKRAM